MEMKVDDVALGERGSELKLTKPGTVSVSVKASAFLNVTPNPELRARNLAQKPYWDIERARLGETRNVPVEVLINGFPVARHTLSADGHTEDLRFLVPMERSGWIAVRIFPSSHTNPVFVLVDGKPIREKRSLEWCLKGVDQCWSQKEKLIAPKEEADAVAAYEHARKTYRERIGEAVE